MFPGKVPLVRRAHLGSAGGGPLLAPRYSADLALRLSPLSHRLDRWAALGPSEPVLGILIRVTFAVQAIGVTRKDSRGAVCADDHLSPGSRLFLLLHWLTHNGGARARRRLLGLLPVGDAKRVGLPACRGPGAIVAGAGGIRFYTPGWLQVQVAQLGRGEVGLAEIAVGVISAIINQAHSGTDRLLVSQVAPP